MIDIEARMATYRERIAVTPGERLRAKRLKAALSQPALGRLLGVTPNTVARWERDEMQPSPMLWDALEHVTRCK